MPFDKNASKIAITLPTFTLKNSIKGRLFTDISDLVYSEPYLVTLAIDSHNIRQESINFNNAEYPNARFGDEIKMLGDGHLIYGPNNPGEFVAISVILMESDKEDRDLQGTLNDLVKSKTSELIKIASNIPTDQMPKISGMILQELSDYVITRLRNNQDDLLFRTSGTFFRDRSVPYDVNRQFTRSNEFAEISIKVIPLDIPNGQGLTPQTIQIQ